MSARTAWGQMIARCYDPEHPKYHRYGGRGIKVCDRWICRRLFLEDMGERPDGMTLNRKDNDGDYSHENCEWASQEDQQQNRSNNRRITFNGETRCLQSWARETGIRRETLAKRLNSGWSVDKALTVSPATNHTTGEVHEDRYLR
jgi:hypothetical protein